jgi:hypothetical protein
MTDAMLKAEQINVDKTELALEAEKDGLKLSQARKEAQAKATFEAAKLMQTQKPKRGE